MTNITSATYGITAWSGKTFRARKPYTCRNCGGVIPIGVIYQRDVERLGARKGKDPIQNVHTHLDCHAPWYQPELPQQLRNFGQLPHRAPPTTVYDQSVGYLKPAVSVSSSALGNLHWQLPEELSQKLAFAPRPGLSVSAVAEIEQVLGIVLTALIQAHGHKRKSLKLSHLINELTGNLDAMPR